MADSRIAPLRAAKASTASAALPTSFWFVARLILLESAHSRLAQPGLLARSSGAITGLANIAPLTVKKCFDLGVQAITTCSAHDLRAAQALQDLVARADSALASTGIGGTKALLQAHFGYGGVPRKPLQPFADKEALSTLEKAMHEIIQMVRRLFCHAQGD